MKLKGNRYQELWFDVETKEDTMGIQGNPKVNRCGLM